MNPIDSYSPLTNLPAEIWAHIVEYLPFKDTQNLGKTCWTAQGIFNDLVSDWAIEESIPALLQQETFSLASVRDACRKNRRFVCAAICVDPNNFDFVHKKLLKDPKVLKTTAVAQLFFKNGLDASIEQNLNEIGEEQFLNSVKSLPNDQHISDKKLWKDLGLATLFDIGNGLFRNDKEVLSSALPHKLETVLSHLKNTNSALLSNHNFMLEALKLDPWSTLKHLQSINSVLLNNHNFMLIALQFESWSTLKHLQSINSVLLNNPEFMLTALKLNLRKTLECLRNTNFALLNNPEFMLEAFQLEPWDTLKCLQNTNSALLNNPEFILEALLFESWGILKHLTNTNSALLNNPEFMLEALPFESWNILKYLQNTNSALLNNPEFRRAVINYSLVEAHHYGYIGIFGVMCYYLPLKAFQWTKDLLLRPFTRHRPKRDH